jgi:adenosylcobinamide kinase/adenosylcobinamide-phosphate guanylyltransferase
VGRLILVLGGARAGKSAYAEQWARAAGGRVLFVATAEAGDDDMRARIARHRAGRPGDWRTLEAPRQTAEHLRHELATAPYDIVLLDCITFLAANVLLALPETADQTAADAAILAEIEALLALQRQSPATWLVVSNEVGLGVVPPTRLGGLFRDALGRANQALARQADEVLLLVAGLPWRLK